MSKLMRCLYCGLLQDEPKGVKTCSRCGGELVFESAPSPQTYIHATMELDQISAPADQVVDRHLVLTINTPPEIPQDEQAPTPIGRESMGFHAVLDTSGSMRGPKMESAKEAVRQAIQRLHDGDVFSLVTFASDVSVVVPATIVDRHLRRKVSSILNETEAGGQTALCGGLEAGIQAARSRKQETDLVLLLSDGQANIGETDLEIVGQRAYDVRRKHDAGQNGVTTSTLGVGSDYNEALMVEIATQGGGRFYHVRDAHQITPYVAGELGEASAIAAQQTVLHLTLPANTGIQPFSSAYQTTSLTDVAIGDIPVDTELEIVLRLLLPTQSAGSRLPIESTLTYRSPAGNELTTPLNIVTLRFMPAPAFEPRDGTVVPVVERVLEQMRARGVLQDARVASTLGAAETGNAARHSVDELHSYAELLGEARAREVAQDQEQVLNAMAATPSVAKASVHAAFRRQRGTKTFDK